MLLLNYKIYSWGMQMRKCYKQSQSHIFLQATQPLWHLLLVWFHLGPKTLHESLLLDCFISNLLMFIVNYENIHPKSSHVIFYLLIQLIFLSWSFAVCQTLFQALVTRLLKPREVKQCALESTWFSGRTGPLIAGPLSSVLSTILLFCIS